MAYEVHKILLGDGAGTYLPFALSKLRAMEALDPDGYFSQWFYIDNWRIHVKQVPPVHYLSIEFIGGLAYEFFTSDHVTDGNPFTSPESLAGGFVWGSATRATFPAKAKVQTKALSSSILHGKWTFRDGDSIDKKTLGFFTREAWQDQKFFEYAWHPNNDGKSLVTSTIAQAPGLAGQCNWMSPYAYRRLANGGSMVSDFGLDVWPTLYTSGGTTSGAPILDQPWVWYRRAAVQTVGGRSFFIHTDNYGRFQVYPVKDYSKGGKVQALVTAEQYKQFTPPYPGWVTLPDPTDYQQQVNDWLWRFNKDATKCVSVPYHSDFSSGFSKTLAGQEFLATLTPAIVAISDPAYANAIVPAREDTPGLVEFGITIKLTGPNDLDFDVVFTLLRNEYFDDRQRFFFDAAYSLPDTEHDPKTDPNFVATDTLITAEVECSYAGTYQAASGDGYLLDSVPAVQGFVVVNANDATMVQTEKLRFATLGGGGTFPTLAGAQAITGYSSGGGPPTIAGFVHILNAITHAPQVIDVNPAGPVTGTAFVGGTPIYTQTSPFPSLPFGHSYGAVFGFLYALELSTISAVYDQNDPVAQTGYLRGVAYGDEFLRVDLGPASAPATDYTPAAENLMLSPRWYQYLLDTTINTEWGTGFSVHPKGHWAYMANALANGSPLLGNDSSIAQAFDWISVKEKDGSRTKYTHKDLFNKAFGQTRDYPFYDVTFPGENFWDQGSFRTQGIWVTFR